MDTYKCSTCKEMLPREQFGADSHAPRGFAYRCKACSRARGRKRAEDPAVREARRVASKAWHEANPERVKEYREKNKDRMRSARLMYDYKITLEQYEEKLAAQDGGCAICGMGPSENGRALAVDHDRSCCPGKRSCGKCVRDLLCQKCNLGIGGFDDDLDRIKAAMEYLRRHHPEW